MVILCIRDVESIAQRDKRGLGAANGPWHRQELDCCQVTHSICLFLISLVSCQYTNLGFVSIREGILMSADLYLLVIVCQNIEDLLPAA